MCVCIGIPENSPLILVVTAKSFSINPSLSIRLCQIFKLCYCLSVRKKKKKKMKMVDDVLSVYDWYRFCHSLEVARDDLLKLDSETKLKVVRQFISSPNADDVDLYYLTMFELQNSTNKAPDDLNREGSNNCIDDDGERLPRQKSIKKKPCPTFSLCKSKQKRSVREHIKPCKKSSVTIPVDEALMAKKPITIRFKLNSGKSSVSKPATCPLDRDYGDEIRKSSADECKMGQKSEKVGSKRPRTDRHYGDEEKVRIKKSMNKTASVVQPELPPEFKQHIENLRGTEVTFVIEKPLYTTDVSTNHGRLSVPLSKIDNGFLRQEEKELLATKIGNRMSPIEAKLIDPSGKECDISLKKWDMPKKSGTVNSIYNLMTGWNNVVKNNSLCEGMIVRLWSFRVGSTLWFVLVKV